MGKTPVKDYGKSKEDIHHHPVVMSMDTGNRLFQQRKEQNTDEHSVERGGRAALFQDILRFHAVAGFQCIHDRLRYRRNILLCYGYSGRGRHDG